MARNRVWIPAAKSYAAIIRETAAAYLVEYELFLPASAPACRGRSGGMNRKLF